MPFIKLTYRVKLLLRITLILLLGFAGLYLVLDTSYWMISAWLGLAVIFLVIELIRYHEGSSKALREFILYLKQEDFSSLSILDEADEELQDAYKIIQDKFRYLRIEKETHYHYLQRIIEHVDTAMISLDNNLEIQLINKAAKELLQVPGISDLRSIEKIDQELFDLIIRIGTGEREMIKLIRHGKILNISVRATEFSLKKDSYKIISLQDIKSELEEQEVESWQKLVRVLTHEIMNSTIPITNMIGIASDFLIDTDGKPKKIPGLDAGEIDDLLLSLNTAESRSSALSNFVQTTKSLTRIPDPEFTKVSVENLFKRIKGLFKKDLVESGITLSINLKNPDLAIQADLELIEQVLINLVRNAIHAVNKTEKPRVELSAYLTELNNTIMKICDNGVGIEKENLDQIFIPFFTTREEGSGIGLSLSRQIMQVHKGRIDVESEPGHGTCFSLEF